MDNAYLILENGDIFKGQSFGADCEAIGELVFNTGMTGYLETLTDPSYYGQIVVQTFPLVGNYGVIPEDFESGDVQVRAYIIREWCEKPSNFRCGGDIDSFLRERGIPGLFGIDTRALTRIVREHGVMNARLSKKPELTPSEMAALMAFQVTGGVDKLSIKKPEVAGSKNARFNVALWDFGAKRNIGRELVKHGCNVATIPSLATPENILSLKPDGIMLTNGPGDPAENTRIISDLKILAKSGIPIFGICLGHQLLALSQGAVTEKLHYGHRGTNQPVLETATGRVFVTSQNHGYAVVSDSLPKTARVSFVNCNDSSCEGIEYTNMPAFSVQFHPEASAGPLDSEWLFDKFTDMMEEARNA